MSKYDPAQDEKLAEVPPIPGEDDTRILVGIFSYAGGPRKIRINRAVTRTSGKTQVRSRLGGLTGREARAVAAALTDLANRPEAGE